MFILIFGGSDHVLDDVTQALRRAGFVAMAAVGDDPVGMLRDTTDVALAVIIGEAAVADGTLEALRDRDILVVIVASSSILGATTLLPAASVLLPENASPWEIASACMAMTGRRIRLDEPSTIEAGPITLDLQQERAFIDGEPVELPPKEFLLLKELVMEHGRPLSSDELLVRVWRDDQPVTPEDVHRHIYRLRGRIGDQDRAEPLIVNRRGYGYAVGAPTLRRPVGSSSRHEQGDAPTLRATHRRAV